MIREFRLTIEQLKSGKFIATFLAGNKTITSQMGVSPANAVEKAWNHLDSYLREAEECE